MKIPVGHDNTVLRTKAGQIEYLPGIGIEDYINSLKRNHFPLYSMLEFDIHDENDFYDFISEMEIMGSDFDGNSPKQRGEMYRTAQQNPMVRSVGISQIFRMVFPQLREKDGRIEGAILDILGGDGTLARTYKKMYPEHDTLVVTSDISGKMIYEANLLGLPAIRQPSHRLLLKSNSMDGLIIAYGTHHIPKSKLKDTYSEAHRVLKPGGVALVHDFEENSPVAQWFQNVVHPWSKTGHDFPHFYPDELKSGLSDARFRAVEEIVMYDPICMRSSSVLGAQIELANYLINMYGLKKLITKYGWSGARKIVLEMAEGIFKYDYAALGLPRSFGKEKISISESDGDFKIELPRLALVAYGKKI